MPEKSYSVYPGEVAGASSLANRDTTRHWWLLTVKFRQPSHEFTFGVGMNFISYPLVLTPLV
jgi:hypothetical protein